MDVAGVRELEKLEKIELLRNCAKRRNKMTSVIIDKEIVKHDEGREGSGTGGMGYETSRSDEEGSRLVE